MKLWGEIEAVRRSWDVGGHPLVRDWAAAPPDAAQLAAYAAGHGRALRALGEGTERLGRSRAVRDDGRLRAAARRELVLADAWARLDLDHADAPGQAIEECAAIWSGREAPGPVEALVILHVVGAARAELATRLGEVVLDPPAAHRCLGTEAALGLAHAELMRELADGLGADPGAAGAAELVSHVEAACSVHWDLLDAIEASVACGAFAHA